MFKRGLTLSLACIVFVAMVGCNDMILGNWTSKEVKPPENAEHFSIGNISFEKDDGSYLYSSTATYGGSEQTSRGVYNFNGMQLKLTSDTGKERNYPTQYNMFTHDLSISHTENGKTTTVVLTKQ